MKTETKAKHTVTPWEVWEDHNIIFANVKNNTAGSITGIQIADCGDEEDADENLGCHPQENAAFIVKAVNQHEFLLKENITLRIQREKLLEPMKILYEELNAELEEPGLIVHTEKYFAGLAKLKEVIDEAEKEVL